jgi:hypothetical protein
MLNENMMAPNLSESASVKALTTEGAEEHRGKPIYGISGQNSFASSRFASPLCPLWFKSLITIHNDSNLTK